MHACLRGLQNIRRNKKIKLPLSYGGKYVEIRKLSGKMIIDSIRKDYGSSIIEKGLVAPKLAQEEINEMPFDLFYFLRTNICRFSGYTFRRTYTKPEFRCEYLEDKGETEKLLRRCEEIVNEHRLTQFTKRMIVSDNFSKSLAKWETYDVINDTFGWTNLDPKERNDLIEKKKLAEMTVGAASLNYDPSTGLFSTIIINKKAALEENLEFIILHELQHNLNALSNFDFIANFDQEILEKRSKEYLEEHNIKKRISRFLATEVLGMLNESFVEREMQQHPYFNKYCENKINMLLKFAKKYRKTKPEKETINSIGFPYYIIRALTVIGPFLEGGNHLCSKVEECFSCFPSAYVEACKEAIRSLSTVHVDTVKFDDVFHMIEAFEIFNSLFVSFGVDLIAN